MALLVRLKGDEQASATLQTILAADDRRQAVVDNLAKIDDGFMYVLSANIAQAEEQGDERSRMAIRHFRSNRYGCRF